MLINLNFTVLIVLIIFFHCSFSSHNKLSSLPVSLGSLASLSSLKLDHNSLTTLGIELGQMKQLEEMVRNSSQYTVFCFFFCLQNSYMALHS